MIAVSVGVSGGQVATKKLIEVKASLGKAVASTRPNAARSSLAVEIAVDTLIGLAKG